MRTRGDLDARVLLLRDVDVDGDLALSQAHLHGAVGHGAIQEEPAGVPGAEVEADRGGVAAEAPGEAQEAGGVEEDGEGVGLGTGEGEVPLWTQRTWCSGAARWSTCVLMHCAPITVMQDSRGQVKEAGHRVGVPADQAAI